MQLRPLPDGQSPVNCPLQHILCFQHSAFHWTQRQ